jgi:hypothetical protein
MQQYPIDKKFTQQYIHGPDRYCKQNTFTAEFQPNRVGHSQCAKRAIHSSNYQVRIGPTPSFGGARTEASYSLALFSFSNSPQILLCKKKIPHHIKMLAHIWSTKYR